MASGRNKLSNSRDEVSLTSLSGLSGDVLSRTDSHRVLT